MGNIEVDNNIKKDRDDPEKILFDKQEGEKLYGIFDGALIKSLWIDVDLWNLEFLPLYRGDYEKIAEAIPYIIELDKDKDADACKKLFKNIGANTSLFIISSLSIDALTEKMQFFYHVKTSSGEAALRRFYDPRNFSDFMKGMNGKNRITFFEGISAYFSEHNQGKELTCFKKEGDELKRYNYPLSLIEEARE